MYWTQTRSSSRSPRPAQPNNRMNDEFIALNRGLLKHASETVSWRRLAAAPGADASAIHGRLGAQVALLQSPILPVAGSLYQEKALFRNVPVDKPHTCHLWLVFHSAVLCSPPKIPLYIPQPRAESGSDEAGNSPSEPFGYLPKMGGNPDLYDCSLAGFTS